MISVLETTKSVVDSSSLVKISSESVDKLVETVKPEDLKVSEVNLFSNNWSWETSLKIIMVFNSINYCFWAKKEEPKWTVEIKGEKLDGAIALFRCLEEEVKRNPNFLNSNELVNLSTEHLEEILKGNTIIPLFKERLECLREMGKSDLLKVFYESENDAIKLADLMISIFPKYNDVSELDGK